MRVLHLFVGVVLSVLATSSYAASFNCEKARTATEHAICDTRAVNDADVKMATTFYIIKRLVPMGTRGVIQDEQVKWLQLRDQCGHSIRCLSEVYQMRQQKLDIYMARVYEQGPF